MSRRDPLGLSGGRSRRGVTGPVVRVFGILIMIGFVFGVWRWLGKGAAIWDPHWFSNAQSTMNDAVHWATHLSDKAKKNHPVPSLNPLPTPHTHPTTGR